MIRNEIVAWVKLQPYWMQAIADLIFKGEAISEDSLDNIYILFKKEYRLIQGTINKECFEFLLQNDEDEIREKMIWNSVSNIKGVNALKEGESIKIGEQVTLIYGENGSGKSGYTRLLNNAFISRGDKTILPNIFKASAIKPSATFNFKDEEDNIKSVKFPENRSNYLFSSVSVFDTVSAVNDLTKESELAFAPMEFRFFDDFTRIFLAIKSRLQAEIENNQQTNEFGNYFDKDTEIKKTIQKINGKTKFASIKKLSEVSDESYKENVKRKMFLQSLNINEKTKEFHKLKQDLSIIKEKIILLNNKFSDDRIMKTEELLVEWSTLKELTAIEGIEQLKGEHIYGLGSTEWKQFILAAKTYYDSIDEEIEECIFCGQSIENIMVINKYWEYLNSTAEKNLSIAEYNIEKIKKDFESQEIRIIIEGSKLEEWLKEYQKDFYNQLIAAEKNFNKIKSEIVENLTDLEWKKTIEPFIVNLSNFDELFTLLDKEIQQLDADKVNKELAKIESKIDEYNDKLKLKKLLPKIESFIYSNKWVGLAKEIRLSTQKITTFQNKLFSEYITSKYIETFDDECKKLDANFSAEIKQRGHKGATLSKLSIKGKSPIEILSEGEQRSIALANFLAETRLNKNNSCLVFDDPVSSLDHVRRERIAERLVEEASHKQVVILTHDITFLISVQNYCSAKGVDCSTTTIRKFRDESGIVQNEAVPWIGMPVQKRINQLRDRLQSMESFYSDIDSSNIDKLVEYEDRAKLWCEQLRETWERTIEEILFNKSVQRFGPAIHTQNLKKAPFTKDLYFELEKGMTNCSKWVHDRAAGLGEAIPEPQELKAYLKDCEDFVKTNRPKG
ncbi:AAA family ATPase [Streptococcus parauberis]|nr:AAA family ATPase [Streptococcus parauberis]